MSHLELFFYSCIILVAFVFVSAGICVLYIAISFSAFINLQARGGKQSITLALDMVLWVQFAFAVTGPALHNLLESGCQPSQQFCFGMRLQCMRIKSSALVIYLRKSAVRGRVAACIGQFCRSFSCSRPEQSRFLRPFSFLKRSASGKAINKVLWMRRVRHVLRCGTAWVSSLRVKGLTVQYQAARICVHRSIYQYVLHILFLVGLRLWT